MAPQTAVDATAMANVTDPGSRIMKTQRGCMHGYNAQAVVTADQIIVADDVTQEANDINQLPAILAEAQEQRHTIEYPQPIGTVLADAGSGSEANLTEADPAGPTLLIDCHEQRLETSPGAAGAALPTRTDPQAAEPTRADGADVANQMGPSPVQEARPDG